VINVKPVPKAVPPDEAANQLIVPALAVADNANVPLSHLLAPVTPVMLGVVLTVAVTVVRVAVVHEPNTDST
jgi:hypothetical protein